MKTLELLKTENLLIIGNEEDNVDSEENSQVNFQLLTSYNNVDLQELSHSLSRFKDVLENYTRNAYEGMRENTVETRTSCTEEPLEERNSAEEDNRDDDSCNRRRVRGSVSFLCLFEKNVPSENSAKLRNKKE